MEVSNDLYATTCTHLPSSGFEIMAPPSFDEIAALADSIGVTITQEAYDLVMAVDDPMEYMHGEDLQKSNRAYTWQDNVRTERTCPCQPPRDRTLGERTMMGHHH